MPLTSTPPLTVTPPEPVTPMKPSEALRLGALAAPLQAFLTFIATQPDGSMAFCAYATLWVPFGYPAKDYDEEGALRVVRQLADVRTGCPQGDCSKDWTTLQDASAILIHLNDQHRWSRGRIADWLEGLGL